MEDENINEVEAKDDVESTSDIPKILNDIINSTVAEPLPSTSKKSSNVRLEDVEKENCSENNSQPLNAVLNSKSQGDDASSSRADNAKKDDRPFEICTVKEMLDEILDCTVIRKPSSLPSTSQTIERNLTDPNLDSPPEYVFDPRLIPRQIFDIRSDNGEHSSRKQSTVKEVISEILDYTVFKKSPNSGSCRAMIVNDFNRPGPSHRVPDYIPQREYTGKCPDYQIYRTMGAGMINSSSAIHQESYIHMPPTRSLNKILPTYSTVLKLGPVKVKSVHSSPSFIPRLPPPTYAEVEGVWEDGPSIISSESVVFGPDPTYMVCPRCRTVVITEVETERSNFTHLMALVMCLCLCWPFCVLPYCLRSCNYTYHTCPNCRHYFGMYRPF